MDYNGPPARPRPKSNTTEIREGGGAGGGSGCLAGVALVAGTGALVMGFLALEPWLDRVAMFVFAHAGLVALALGLVAVVAAVAVWLREYHSGMR